jgi:hypothetical protein
MSLQETACKEIVSHKGRRSLFAVRPWFLAFRFSREQHVVLSVLGATYRGRKAKG